MMVALVVVVLLGVVSMVLRLVDLYVVVRDVVVVLVMVVALVVVVLLEVEIVVLRLVVLDVVA